MINHIDIKVDSLEDSKKFYQHVLEPLGYIENISTPYMVSFSDKKSSDLDGDFYLSKGTLSKFHFTFQADSHKQVDECY